MMNTSTPRSQTCGEHKRSAAESTDRYGTMLLLRPMARLPTTVLAYLDCRNGRAERLSMTLTRRSPAVLSGRSVSPDILCPFLAFVRPAETTRHGNATPWTGPPPRKRGPDCLKVSVRRSAREVGSSHSSARHGGNSRKGRRADPGGQS